MVSTTRWRAARGRDLVACCRGFHGANEGAYELTFRLRCKSIDVDAFAREKLPRILNRVDPRRFDANRLEPGVCQLVPVFFVPKRSRYAPDPEQHLFAHLD